MKIVLSNPSLLAVKYPYEIRTHKYLMANKIDSKTKRERLTARREPYWATLEKYVEVIKSKLGKVSSGLLVVRALDIKG